MKTTTRKLALIAILIALTVSLSLLFIIPIPATKGFMTLCEVGIYTSAILLKNPAGLAVGGLSGLLIDLLSGYPQWCLFSLIIHGLQGLTAGYLTSKKNTRLQIILALFISSLIMIIGYFLATSFLFGWPAGFASIPGNIIQNIFGIIVTVPLVFELKRVHPRYLN